MATFGAVIVSYNSAGELSKCIDSFKKQRVEAKDAFITCVVDNDSKDESVKIAEKNSDFIIKNSSNKGFACAVNQGIKLLLKKRCDYILILNPDAVVKNGALKDMSKLLDSDKEIGAVGPRMVNADGSDANSGYYLKAPSLLTVAFFSTHLRPFSVKNRWLMAKYQEQLGDKKQEVHQIPGAAILTSRKKLEDIGLLSEEFAIWFEDVEWCYRARKKSYKMMFCPSANFVHEGGVSFSKWNDINKAVTFYVSMKTFFRLHKPLQLPLVVLVICLNSLFTYIKTRDRSNLAFVKLFLTQKRGILPK